LGAQVPAPRRLEAATREVSGRRVAPDADEGIEPTLIKAAAEPTMEDSSHAGVAAAQRPPATGPVPNAAMRKVREPLRGSR